MRSSMRTMYALALISAVFLALDAPQARAGGFGFSIGGGGGGRGGFSIGGGRSPSRGLGVSSGFGRRVPTGSFGRRPGSSVNIPTPRPAVRPGSGVNVNIPTSRPVVRPGLGVNVDIPTSRPVVRPNSGFKRPGNTNPVVRFPRRPTNIVNTTNVPPTKIDVPKNRLPKPEPEAKPDPKPAPTAISLQFYFDRLSKDLADPQKAKELRDLVATLDEYTPNDKEQAAADKVIQQAASLQDALSQELLKGVKPGQQAQVQAALEQLKAGNGQLLQQLAQQGLLPAGMVQMCLAAQQLGQAAAGGQLLMAHGLIHQLCGGFGLLGPGVHFGPIQHMLFHLHCFHHCHLHIICLGHGHHFLPYLPIFVDVIPVPSMLPATFGDGILLLNPLPNELPISYVLNNQYGYTMKAGQFQMLPPNRPWTIEFDRGNDSGRLRYDLTPGTYEFVINPDGWDLVRRAEYEVTIDNSQLSVPFTYLCNGKQQVLPPGGQMTHRSRYPLQIAFDRGDGGPPINKRLRGGVFMVGIDALHGRLDLFNATNASQSVASDAPAPPGVPTGG